MASKQRCYLGRGRIFLVGGRVQRALVIKRAILQMWDKRTKRGLFGDRKLQLTLLSTSRMPGTVSGVEVIGMCPSALEEFAVCYG